MISVLMDFVAVAVRATKVASFGTIDLNAANFPYSCLNSSPLQNKIIIIY
jgi:hypothetical protein